MLNLIVNSARVSYDTLEEAKAVAEESGLGLVFWRETFSECVENETMWNEFLNDLWQSGAEDEAERLNLAFPKETPRHWLLVALMLDGDDPWRAFLAEWETRGDECILASVSSPAFAPWLKRVQTGKYDLLVRAFGADAARWPSDLLLNALKSEGGEAEIAEWRAVLTERNLKPGDEMTITLTGGVPMTFCWCPATTSEVWKRISGGEDFFWMGSPESESDRHTDETRHRVRLTKGFWMGKNEVTQRQWECVMGFNPSYFKGPDHPVEQVSWNDCQEYVQKINSAGKACISLPTEAQWEYACRAGTTTPFNFGSALNGDKANCDGNYPYGTTRKGQHRGETAPVGTYVPNVWGLYGMHGNVWEWCQDWYGDYTGDEIDPVGSASGCLRVSRGGGYDTFARCCRSALRPGLDPDYRDRVVGLRLVCSLAVTSQLELCPRHDVLDRADSGVGKKFTMCQV